MLGILSLMLCQLVGPAAWIVGAKARREIDAEPGRWGGRSQATAGYVLGTVSTVLLLGVVVVVIAVIATAA